MQLRHLETFLAIVDFGTLTAAAAHLYKTQGAVSQDLKALEGRLGLELIDRRGQRIQLTPAGQALLPMARRLLAEVSDVEEEMARVRTGDRPILRVGCLPSVGIIVTDLLAGFRNDHPELRWTVETALRGVMLDRLRDGRLDLVICEAQAEENIANTPLIREPLHIVLPIDHPLAQSARLRSQDVAHLPYIGLARGMGATVEAQRFFTAGGSYPTPTVEVTDTRLVLNLVNRLQGFGIVPESALPQGGQLGVVATDPLLVRQLALAHLADRVLSPTALAFADFVRQNWPGSTPA